MARYRLSAVVSTCASAWLLVACGGTPHRSATPHEGTAAGHAGSAMSVRADLRSPDVDGRMDPAPRATVFACPRVARVEVIFDPRGTVALLSGGRPLVYGSVGTRVVNRSCRSRGRLHGVPKGVMRGHIGATTLTCVVPASPRFEVHPITVGGREIGSTVALLEPNLRSIVLSAVLEPGGSRVYHGRACRAP
jgi:hypothetical protein